MSTVIKGGTIVAADRTYQADVLIEGEKIAAIGPNLTGDKTVDAAGAYIMPGGIDPHTHLEMPFMGTTAAETWESGTFAALSGGTTMVVDFVIPGPDGMLAALDDWEAPRRHVRRPRTIRCTCASMAGRRSISTRWPRWSIAASTPSSISWPTRAR